MSLRKPLAAIAVLAAAFFAPADAAAQQRADGPRRVILIVGDGVGLAQWSAAQLVTDTLAVSRLPEIGLVDARCACRRTTDSGAAATAYATGERTFYTGIGVGPDSLPRTSVLEWARRGGLAAGLVTTTDITDATPAAFAAHVSTRYQRDVIARQMAEQGIEVLLGGGRGLFDGTLRADSQDLLAEMKKRYTYVQTPAALLALRADTVSALLGLFTHDKPWPDSTHLRPALPEMARAALAVLDRDPDGFFLLLESEDTDDINHENLPFDRLARGMAELNATVEVALDYQRRNPETLVVVTGDHETGGLMVGMDSKSGEYVATYGTRSHSMAMLPLFAGGPGSERFGRILTNAAVGNLLREAVAPGSAETPSRTTSQK